MLQKFYPDEYRESAYGLDYEGLCRQGYKGIIFDIDNTLVPHGAPADAESIALFKRLRGLGYSCVLLSNNKEPRVKSFADEVGALYIYKAGNPRLRAIEGRWNGWERTGRTLCLLGISFLRISGEQKMRESAAFW